MTRTSPHFFPLAQPFVLAFFALVALVIALLEVGVIGYAYEKMGVNHRWVSTLHRVGIPPRDTKPQDRISLVFFTNPNPDAEIRCIEQCIAPGEAAKYPPVQVSEHYLGKLMRAGHSKVDAKAADALTH